MPYVPVTEREHFLCTLISGNRTRVFSRKEENHKQTCIFIVCPISMAKASPDKAHMILIKEWRMFDPRD